MPVTFVVDPSAAPVEVRLKPCSAAEVVAAHLGPPRYAVLKASDEGVALQRMPFGNGFVGAALTAYNQHLHLVLKPDDVWVAITQALASYVDRHAEAMRDSFVAFAGQRTLTVHGNGTLHSADWDALIAEMGALIDANTKADVASWMAVDFSTSTPQSRTVSKVVCMAAMKHYFKYVFPLECGLPAVTLLGERQDWVEIGLRAARLATLGQQELSAWHAELAPVLAQFVAAFDGQADADFWNRIACTKGGGSFPLTLSGWVLVFAPWDNDGRFCLGKPNHPSHRGMEQGKVPSGYVDCPVLIDDNGTPYQCRFVAGSMGALYDAEQRTLAPSLDWIMLHDLEAK